MLYNASVLKAKHHKYSFKNTHRSFQSKITRKKKRIFFIKWSLLQDHCIFPPY